MFENSPWITVAKQILLLDVVKAMVRLKLCVTSNAKQKNLCPCWSSFWMCLLAPKGYQQNMFSKTLARFIQIAVSTMLWRLETLARYHTVTKPEYNLMEQRIRQARSIKQHTQWYCCGKKRSNDIRTKVSTITYDTVISVIEIIGIIDRRLNSILIVLHCNLKMRGNSPYHLTPSL